MKARYDVFLSGPMSGYPEWNYPAFREAAATIRALGLTVYCPADDDDTTKPREYYMRLCITALLRSGCLVSLPQWSSSAGAHLERQVAKELGLPCWNLASFLKAQAEVRVP